MSKYFKPSENRFLPEVPIDLKGNGLLLGYEMKNGKWAYKYPDAKEDFDFDQEVEDFSNYFKEAHPEEISDFSKEIIEIDYDDLISATPHLGYFLFEYPEETIQKISDKFGKKVLFSNYNHELELYKIRIGDSNKFYMFKGIIKRVTTIIPRIIDITFKCESCGTEITIAQNKKKESQPKKCSCGRKGGFEEVRKNMIDIQELTLEEPQEKLQGRQPQQKRVYLEKELTEENCTKKLQPGRKINVYGFLEPIPIFMTAKDEQSNITELIVKANNVESAEADEDILIGEEDIKKIEEIAYGEDPLGKLANNMVPDVFGNELIKKAIVLQSFKATPHQGSDGAYKDGQINIIFIGDPGISKSVTLKNAVARTPRAKMVIGTKTSRVGLGAMAVQDELTGSWTLEAGALILCSGSMLAIDELDKMNKEHLSELLEPMSNETVSVNKAGIEAKFSAKTSILAAANPVHGSYDLTQPLAKQIDLPSPILDRFDLKFVLLDRPNEENDANIAGHMLSNKSNKSELSIPFLKKYISYCRERTPSFDDETLTPYLQDFYAEIRRKTNRNQGIPVTPRLILSVRKLAEANAKIRLSPKVEFKDIEVAKDIYYASLQTLAMDETGKIDMSRLTEKMPASKRGKMEMFLSLFFDLYDKKKNEWDKEGEPMISYQEILDLAQAKGMKYWEINMFLESLKRETKIFEPQKGFYRGLE